MAAPLLSEQSPATASPRRPISILFLAAAAGAILYVIGELYHVARRAEVKTAAAFGLLVGFLVANGAELVLGMSGWLAACNLPLKIGNGTAATCDTERLSRGLASGLAMRFLSLRERMEKLTAFLELQAAIRVCGKLLDRLRDFFQTRRR